MTHEHFDTLSERLEAQLTLAGEETNKGNFDEAENIANAVLAEVEKPSQLLTASGMVETIRANAILALASTNYRRGNYDASLEQAHRGLALAENHTLISIKTKAWNIIGSVYSSLGSYDKALEYLAKALAVHEELAEKSEVAGVTGNIGGVYYFLGSYDKALEYYHKALAVHEELGAKSSVALVTGNIGNVYYSLGSYDKALEYYAKALAVHEELGEKSGVARVTGNIGGVYSDLGTYDKALEYSAKALAVHEELGEKSGVATVTGNIGSVYATSKFEGYDAVKAEEYLLKAIAICTEIGAKAFLVEFHKSLADLYKQEEKWKEFALYFEKYIEIKDELNIEETKKQDTIREQQKAIELAKATAAAKLNATTTLLHKVLPESIATRIIAGEKDIADYFPFVSILFADIAGFTPISAGMPAYVVVRFLNYVFGTFDVIMKKHGCEKIKTIGDGYMAVAGAPIECADHAERMALAALEMQDDIRLPEEFREYLPEGVDFGIRVGLHTGSVVGGVIGDERFVYDIYSDSVNTAARMESHGEPDKIHVSHEYYIHLQNRFAMTKNITHGMTFEKRGEMAIKGKGMMKTYFLEKTQ